MIGFGIKSRCRPHIQTSISSGRTASVKHSHGPLNDSIFFTWSSEANGFLQSWSSRVGHSLQFVPVEARSSPVFLLQRPGWSSLHPPTPTQTPPRLPLRKTFLPRPNLSFVGLLQAKFGTCSSRLNFPRLTLVPPRAGLKPLAELVVPRAGLRCNGALRWASWFARREGLRAFPRVRPPQLRLHSLPRPAWLSSGMAAGGESRCYPAASPPLHFRAPPAWGDARCRPRALSVRRPAPPRPASRLPAPSAVPLPRRGRRERAGQRGVKPTRLRRGGIRRRAELGAEAASAKKKNVRLRRPTSSIGGTASPPGEPRAAKPESRPSRADPSARAGPRPPSRRRREEKGWGGKPEPALPAKVNFNRGGWMQSPCGR